MSSNSEGRPVLRVTAENSATEIRVVDYRYRTVASGIGDVSQDLPPGLYSIRAQLAEETCRRVVVHEAHRPVEERVELSVQSVLPIPGTEAREDPTEQRFLAVTRAMVRVPPTAYSLVHHDAEVLVVVRDVVRDAPRKRGRRAIRRGAESLRLEPLGRNPWENSDGLVSPVLEQTHAEPDPGATTAVRFTTAEGAFALRFPGAENLIQSLYVARGWCTIILVPALNGRLIPGLTSVHMSPAGAPWSPDDTQASTLAAASEAILASLRRGRAIVPPNLMNMLLRAKFDNPMLGILGAHALLRQSEPQAERLMNVLENLDVRLPGHPDIRALKLMASDVLPKSSTPVRWKRPGVFADPPMLLASLRGVLRHDAAKGGVIAPRSPMEAAASRLLVHGPWTTWKQAPTRNSHSPPESYSTRDAPPESFSSRDRYVSGAAGAPRLPPLGSVREPKTLHLGSSGLPEGWRERIGRLRFRDPGTVRVFTHVAEVARLSKEDSAIRFLDGLDRGSLSLVLGLPHSVVDRALDAILSKLET